MDILTVEVNTVFKARPVQSRELESIEKVPVIAPATFNVLAHMEATGKHIKCTFDQQLGDANKNTWYAFSEHVQLNLENPEGYEKPEPEFEKPGRDDDFRLPGYRSIFYLADPILPGGNFSWAEATKGGTRIPVNKKIVQNILRIADTMEEIRSLFGDRPITITSWYRDPVSNRRVGGASRSQHLTGGAVDFVIAGVHPSEVQRRLDPWWGSRGGLASASSFTHIDNRGYRARWRY